MSTFCRPNWQIQSVGGTTQHPGQEDLLPAHDPPSAQQSSPRSHQYSITAPRTAGSLARSSGSIAGVFTRHTAQGRPQGCPCSNQLLGPGQPSTHRTPGGFDRMLLSMGRVKPRKPPLATSLKQLWKKVKFLQWREMTPKTWDHRSSSIMALGSGAGPGIYHH